MRNLQVALILFGAIHLAQGVVLITNPDRIAKLMEFVELGVELPDYVPYLMALLGSAFIAAGVWFIIAGRDPVGNITWVKFAILWSILLLVIQLYSLAQGYVDFSQVWLGIFEDAIFAVAFLFFYPYRRR